ncbi:hypothetical protein Goshw_021193, partial [Gossypium schwendimanii]|nr:hypothetical protein [Gossypium schwendimanii]
EFHPRITSFQTILKACKAFLFNFFTCFFYLLIFFFFFLFV